MKGGKLMEIGDSEKKRRRGEVDERRGDNWREGEDKIR